MIKEILKSDIGILNKYFLVTLILVLLTIVGYTSYALFSYEEISTTGIRIKYTGGPKQSEGNLNQSWRYKTSNESSYLALFTINTKTLPSTYIYKGTTYTLNTTIDVSAQGNGNVILGEYISGSNIIAVIGQDGKVMAPVDSDNLFGGLSNITIIDLSNLDTSKVTDMSYMFIYTSSISSIDLSNFDTSNVTNMSYMFQGCTKLKEIKVGCNWVIGTSTTTTNMFYQAGTSSVTKEC